VTVDNRFAGHQWEKRDGESPGIRSEI